MGDDQELVRDDGEKAHSGHGEQSVNRRSKWGWVERMPANEE